MTTESKVLEYKKILHLNVYALAKPEENFGMNKKDIYLRNLLARKLSDSEVDVIKISGSGGKLGDSVSESKLRIKEADGVAAKLNSMLKEMDTYLQKNQSYLSTEAKDQKDSTAERGLPANFNSFHSTTNGDGKVFADSTLHPAGNLKYVYDPNYIDKFNNTQTSDFGRKTGDTNFGDITPISPNASFSSKFGTPSLSGNAQDVSQTSISRPLSSDKPASSSRTGDMPRDPGYVNLTSAQGLPRATDNVPKQSFNDPLGRQSETKVPTQSGTKMPQNSFSAEGPSTFGNLPNTDQTSRDRQSTSRPYKDGLDNAQNIKGDNALADANNSFGPRPTTGQIPADFNAQGRNTVAKKDDIPLNNSTGAHDANVDARSSTIVNRPSAIQQNIPNKPNNFTADRTSSPDFPAPKDPVQNDRLSTNQQGKGPSPSITPAISDKQPQDRFSTSRPSAFPDRPSTTDKEFYHQDMSRASSEVTRPDRPMGAKGSVADDFDPTTGKDDPALIQSGGFQDANISDRASVSLPRPSSRPKTSVNAPRKTSNPPAIQGDATKTDTSAPEKGPQSNRQIPPNLSLSLNQTQQGKTSDFRPSSTSTSIAPSGSVSTPSNSQRKVSQVGNEDPTLIQSGGFHDANITDRKSTVIPRPSSVPKNSINVPNKTTNPPQPDVAVKDQAGQLDPNATNQQTRSSTKPFARDVASETRIPDMPSEKQVPRPSSQSTPPANATSPNGEIFVNPDYTRVSTQSTQRPPSFSNDDRGKSFADPSSLPQYPGSFSQGQQGRGPSINYATNQDYDKNKRLSSNKLIPFGPQANQPGYHQQSGNDQNVNLNRISSNTITGSPTARVSTSPNQAQPPNDPNRPSNVGRESQFSANTLNNSTRKSSELTQPNADTNTNIARSSSMNPPLDPSVYGMSSRPSSNQPAAQQDPNANIGRDSSNSVNPPNFPQFPAGQQTSQGQPNPQSQRQSYNDSGNLNRTPTNPAVPNQPNVPGSFRQTITQNADPAQSQNANLSRGNSASINYPNYGPDNQAGGSNPQRNPSTNAPSSGSSRDVNINRTPTTAFPPSNPNTYNDAIRNQSVYNPQTGSFRDMNINRTPTVANQQKDQYKPTDGQRSPSANFQQPSDGQSSNLNRTPTVNQPNQQYYPNDGQRSPSVNYPQPGDDQSSNLNRTPTVANQPNQQYNPIDGQRSPSVNYPQTGDPQNSNLGRTPTVNQQNQQYYPNDAQRSPSVNYPQPSGDQSSNLNRNPTVANQQNQQYYQNDPQKSPSVNYPQPGEDQSSNLNRNPTVANQQNQHYYPSDPQRSPSVNYPQSGDGQSSNLNRTPTVNQPTNQYYPNDPQRNPNINYPQSADGQSYNLNRTPTTLIPPNQPYPNDGQRSPSVNDPQSADGQNYNLNRTPTTVNPPNQPYPNDGQRSPSVNYPQSADGQNYNLNRTPTAAQPSDYQSFSNDPQRNPSQSHPTESYDQNSNLNRTPTTLTPPNLSSFRFNPKYTNEQQPISSGQNSHRSNDPNSNISQSQNTMNQPHHPSTRISTKTGPGGAPIYDQGQDSNINRNPAASVDAPGFADNSQYANAQRSQSNALPQPGSNRNMNLNRTPTTANPSNQPGGFYDPQRSRSDAGSPDANDQNSNLNRNPSNVFTLNPQNNASDPQRSHSDASGYPVYDERGNLVRVPTKPPSPDKSVTRGSTNPGYDPQSNYPPGNINRMPSTQGHPQYNNGRNSLPMNQTLPKYPENSIPTQPYGSSRSKSPTQGKSFSKTGGNLATQDTLGRPSATENEQNPSRKFLPPVNADKRLSQPVSGTSRSPSRRSVNTPKGLMPVVKDRPYYHDVCKRTPEEGEEPQLTRAEILKAKREKIRSLPKIKQTYYEKNADYYVEMSRRLENTPSVGYRHSNTLPLPERKDTTSALASPREPSYHSAVQAQASGVKRFYQLDPASRSSRSLPRYSDTSFLNRDTQTSNTNIEYARLVRPITPVRWERVEPGREAVREAGRGAVRETGREAVRETARGNTRLNADQFCNFCDKYFHEKCYDDFAKKR
jgi:hypothetical protein